MTALLGGTAHCEIFGRTVKATIPAGARAGRLITVPGEGLKHPSTGEAGDLKLRVVLDLPEGARKLTKAAANPVAASRTWASRSRTPRAIGLTTDDGVQLPPSSI